MYQEMFMDYVIVNLNNKKKDSMLRKAKKI